MKLAAKRLENIGWLALVFLVAILLYPLSLQVAAVRSDLSRTEKSIVSVKKDIHYLETEFSARANLRQLEYWNEMEYGYASPTSSQYLDGERALANLGTGNFKKPVRVAVLSSMDGIKPAGIIGSPFGSIESKAAVSKEKDESSSVAPDAAAEDAPTASKAQQLAQMDGKLLGDGLLSDINMRASVESIGGGQ